MNHRVALLALAAVALNPLGADSASLKLAEATQVAPRLAWDEGKPVFNGPRVFGATPGRAFTYTFPVRGSRKGLVFSVTDGKLPDGVALDGRTGVLAGRAAAAGMHRLTVEARNDAGSARIAFTLEIGPGKMLRTPLLGWTSWNALCTHPSQAEVLAQARLLKSLGLAARGYLFVNVDTGWQGDRADPLHWRVPEGIVTNAMMANAAFPDMRAMVAALHAMGFKSGLYSSPMVCAWGTSAAQTFRGTTDYPLDPKFRFDHFGGIGKRVFEREDARQLAAWGVDYLKYDWALTDTNHVGSMRAALDATDRDIVLSICQPSSIAGNAVAYERWAQMHRTSGDIADEWAEIVAYAKGSRGWLAHTRPGCWGDLDMLGLGRMRVRRWRQKVPFYTPLADRRYDNRLTRDEVIAHFLFWAVAPSPLQLSFDLRAADAFTLDLVSNEELLAINQDYPFSAPTFREEKGVVLLARRLSDGRVVQGAFNFGNAEATVEVALPGSRRVRDPLAGRDLGAADRLVFTLKPHAARVVTCAPAPDGVVMLQANQGKQK